MSNDRNLLADFVASVIARIFGLREAGDDLVESLRFKIAAGSRTAKETLDNPWNSSVPPSRRMPDIETRLDELRQKVEEIGPEFLAAAMEIERLEKQREYQRDREQTLAPVAVDSTAGPHNAGYDRLIQILRTKAGVSNRDAQRVSIETICQAGGLIKRQAELRWCDEIVSTRELLQAGLLQHVSVAVGWSTWTGEVYYPKFVRNEEGFDPLECRTILPTLVNVDPPEFPRSWTPESSMAMFPVLWDALPTEPFYRSFVRKLEERENPAFYWASAWPDDTEPMPPFPTLDAMIRFDEDFRAAYERAERRFRVLDGRRAEMKEICIEELAGSSRKRDQEMMEWIYPVEAAVLLETPLWDAWRPWGTLICALKDYLNFHELGERGCPIFAWTYFLKGRLMETEEQLPSFVRHALFDWMMLPVPSVLGPATRILIPRDRLASP